MPNRNGIPTGADRSRWRRPRREPAAYRSVRAVVAGRVARLLGACDDRAFPSNFSEYGYRLYTTIEDSVCRARRCALREKAAQKRYFSMITIADFYETII